MPIQSYLVYPVDGEKQNLIDQLTNISCCEITDSENNDLFILLTDTENEHKEALLQEELKLIPQIQGMVLVYAQEG